MSFDSDSTIWKTEGSYLKTDFNLNFMVQTNLFWIDLTSPDPNPFKATYWVWISWERNNIQKPVSNRGSLYEKERIHVSVYSCDMECMYPYESCPYLFKQLISENLLRNPNSCSAPISACWPHYQNNFPCFLVIHQCKGKEIEAEPASKGSSPPWAV